MTICLGKSCSFGLPRVPFVNCCQFMYLVISLLVLRAGCGIWLYQFLIIAYLFTLRSLDTPSLETTISSMKGADLSRSGTWVCSFLLNTSVNWPLNSSAFSRSDWATQFHSSFSGVDYLGRLFSDYWCTDITSDIESEIRPFADDCVCCREVKDEKDTVKLQRDNDRLGCWARKWGMRFQPVKCNMMQLTRKWVKKSHASYTLKGTDLENVESIKYLEVTITNHLRWNTHVSNVCTKANRTIGFLRRNLHSCPQEVNEAAYKGLVARSWSMAVRFGTSQI